MEQILQCHLKEKLLITDPNMTRFSLTMNEALDFILESAYLGNGSEVFVPKIKSYSLTDLKETIKELLGNVGDKNISLRPGEKLHEVLINQDEVRYTWEYYDNYVIFTPEKDVSEIKKMYSKIKKLNISGNYSSDSVKKHNRKELRTILLNSGLIPNKK